jgi:hypothetical protein
VLLIPAGFFEDTRPDDWQGHRTLCSASVISVKAPVCSASVISVKAPVLMKISAPIMMNTCYQHRSECFSVSSGSISTSTAARIKVSTTALSSRTMDSAIRLAMFQVRWLARGRGDF